MKVRTLMGAAVALLGMTEAVLADGPWAKSSPTWSGLYMGFQAGGAWGSTGWNFPFAQEFNSAAGEHFVSHPTGGSFGGQVGFNHQIGNFLLGVEVSYAANNMIAAQTGPLGGLPDNRYSTFTSDLFTATGRLGVVADKVLLYGKAGYADAAVNLKAAGGGATVLSDNQRDAGWIAGGGLEYRIMRGLIFGVEYNYVNLDGGHITGTTSTPGSFNVNLDDIHIHTVTARLSILLDRDPTTTGTK